VPVIGHVLDGGPRLDRPKAVDLPCREEERLEERRLSRPAVTDDGDVADLGGLGHGRSVLLRASASGRGA
jgi:hypothetical protein